MYGRYYLHLSLFILCACANGMKARMYAHQCFACVYPLYIMPAPIAHVAHILCVTLNGTGINNYQVKYLVQVFHIFYSLPSKRKWI